MVNDDDLEILSAESSTESEGSESIATTISVQDDHPPSWKGRGFGRGTTKGRGRGKIEVKKRLKQPKKATPEKIEMIIRTAPKWFKGLRQSLKDREGRVPSKKLLEYVFLASRAAEASGFGAGAIFSICLAGGWARRPGGDPVSWTKLLQNVYLCNCIENQ